MIKLIQQQLNNLLELIFPHSPEEKRAKKVSLKQLESKLQTQKIHGEDIVTFFNYKDPQIKELIKQAKYKGNRSAVEKISEFIYPELMEYTSELYVFENIDNAILVPIPLSRRKLSRRGFNQSARIAKEVIKKDSSNTFKIEGHLLFRIKDTLSQTQTGSKKERERNLKDAFQVKKPEKAKGQIIFLLDDVITTGSTMKEAKKELLKAGASRVICVAAARS